MKISIVVVSLNPGEDLNYTLNSIHEQTYQNYEVIIKDGGSDPQIVLPFEDIRFRLITEEDQGIYDAMNRAVTFTSGEYVLFLNCGDRFYTNTVLDEVVDVLEGEIGKNVIGYGDTYFKRSDSVAKAAPKITGFVCYRNIPCHQAIFYSRTVLANRGFDTNYKVRADFEHFHYCFFQAGSKFVYLDRVICEYQGGGYSELSKNRKTDIAEYREIVRKYISKKDRFKYRAILILTLHKVRGVLARSKTFGKYYQKLKGMLYS